MRKKILQRLADVEAEHNVTVLYACESGSRAWGFASPDSDYDVRFIYAHPVEWYLAFDVEQRRDVIESPIVDDLDCTGWDVRKALYLFTRTNGALLEWLKSPIKYIERGALAVGLRQLEARVVNLRALCYHYSHMARGNAKDYLYREQARLKKYFYVLRPLLAIRHIEKYSEAPPTEFVRLVESVAPEQIKPAITKLLELKTITPEIGFGPPIKELNDFIDAENERHGDAFKGQGRPEMDNGEELREALNELFREAICGK